MQQDDKISTVYFSVNVSISTKTRSKTIHDNVPLCLIYTKSNRELQLSSAEETVFNIGFRCVGNPAEHM
jgi:hypothetical protein